nr:MAG TPA: hypothetical protein [Bacteriophage sp.]
MTGRRWLSKLIYDSHRLFNGSTLGRVSSTSFFCIHYIMKQNKFNRDYST